MDAITSEPLGVSSLMYRSYCFADMNATKAGHLKRSALATSSSLIIADNGSQPLVQPAECSRKPKDFSTTRGIPSKVRAYDWTAETALELRPQAWPSACWTVD